MDSHESQYRIGAHHALSLLRQWCDRHNADPADILNDAEDIARSIRFSREPRFPWGQFFEDALDTKFLPTKEH